jgi:hypothetical protein
MQRKYGVRFIYYVSTTAYTINNNYNDLPTVFARMSVFYGTSNMGLDVHSRLGGCIGSRSIRVHSNEVTAAYKVELDARCVDPDQVFATWFDNYCHLYYATILRVDRAHMHSHAGTAHGVILSPTARSMAVPMQANGDIHRACSNEWWKMTRIVDVCTAVLSDVKKLDASMWRTYHLTSLCNVADVTTCPPRTASSYLHTEAEFKPYEMHSDKVGSLRGMHDTITRMAVQKDVIWARGDSTITVADITIYMTRHAMAMSVYAPIETTAKFDVMFLGLWHTGKKLCETIFERHFLSFFAPLLRYMYPNKVLWSGLKYQNMMQLMCDVAVAIKQEGQRLTDALLEARQTDTGKHIYQLLFYFIPLVSQ